MKKIIISASLLAIASLALGGCVTTPSRFEWGAYESSLYNYAKKPEKRQAYKEALEQAIAKGQATHRVAPGLNAELGYLHLEDGDTNGAVSCFEEEIRLFPESKPFLSKVIARAKGQPEQTSGAAS